MTCGSCGMHICWVCMETFGTAKLCYDHLHKEHGGFYDRDEEDGEDESEEDNENGYEDESGDEGRS